jgi:hypothetical protein
MSDKKIKYKNYQELKKAYESGELTKKDILYLDNDQTFVYVNDKCVFQGNGYEDIEELAKLAGFPAEWV